MGFRRRPGEAGAADHHVYAMMQRVGPDAAPQQFQRALAAIAVGDAGAAEFEEAFVGVAGDQRIDGEFARAVEAEMGVRHALAQQAIGADHLRRAVQRRKRGIHDDEMIANPVEGADVAPDKPGGPARDGAALLEEDLIAQLLRLSDFLFGGGESRLERAGGRQNPRQTGEIGRRPGERRSPRSARPAFRLRL